MDWQERIGAVWARADDLPGEQLVEAIDALVAERADTDAIALFEAAGARDYAGHEADAEPLYLRALELELPEPHRAQAVIQLASTLRNLGRPEQSAAILESELREHPEHELADAARAFLALAQHDAGRPTEALQLALRALAAHLPQYGRAVSAYAAELRAP